MGLSSKSLAAHRGLRNQLGALCFTALFWLGGCGDESGNGPTPPPNVPDIAGLWSGTETVDLRGGSQCLPAIRNGSRTGEIFRVTQNGQAIVISQFVNCVICQYTGTISADGSFSATGAMEGVTIRLQGQVSGNRMTATRSRPTGVDCDHTATYDLTQG